MKAINNFINEKLKINKNTKVDKYHYFPKDKYVLEKLVKQLIKERGNNADLNDIDTSKITHMGNLFDGSKFNGDISEWDVSNVTNMNYMFSSSNFNSDISKWNVKKVKQFEGTFAYSKFSQDINDWNIDNNSNMKDMFRNCPLEKNPPSWYKK